MACPHRLVADQPAIANTRTAIRHLTFVFVEYIDHPPEFNCRRFDTYNVSACSGAAFL
jgi:hypothetical protein